VQQAEPLGDANGEIVGKMGLLRLAS
jgi:hypothetical protein